MTTFPRSPRLIKGAIIGVDQNKTPQTVVLFQYNPEKMTRRLEARAARQGSDNDRTEPLRLSGPPRETITLKIELDAADQLEQQNPVATATGIHPALASLELLLYPTSQIINSNNLRATQGVLEIVPMETPLTLFVWGPQRVVPVRLTSMGINEEAYDPMLNPIQAEIDLSLEVLTTSDFMPDHPGYDLYMAYQLAKEGLSLTSSTRSMSDLGFSLRL